MRHFTATQLSAVRDRSGRCLPVDARRRWGVGKLGRSKVGLGRLGFGKVGRQGGKLGRGTTSESA